MEPLKVCVKCKHAFLLDEDKIGSVWYCQNRKAVGISLVTGNTNFQSCHIQRNSSLTTACGKDGQFFEEK